MSKLIGEWQQYWFMADPGIVLQWGISLSSDLLIGILVGGASWCSLHVVGDGWIILVLYVITGFFNLPKSPFFLLLISP